MYYVLMYGPSLPQNPNPKPITRLFHQIQTMLSKRKPKLPHHTAVYTFCLLLLALIHFSPANASTSSIRQATRILQSDGVNNSTNATNPDESTNATQPTASPVAPSTPEVAPPPAPAAPTTHEPTRKYEPSSDDEEKEKEEEEKTNHRWHVVFGVVTLIALIGSICYFRDAIVFFLGTVSWQCCCHSLDRVLYTIFANAFSSRSASIQTVTGAKVV